MLEGCISLSSHIILWGRGRIEAGARTIDVAMLEVSILRCSDDSFWASLEEGDAISQDPKDCGLSGDIREVRKSGW